MLHELKKLFSVLALTSQFSVHIRNPDNKKNPPTQKYFPPTCTLFAVLPIVGSGMLLASGGLTAYSKACRGKWNIFLELALEQTMIDAQPTQTLMHTYPHKSNGSVGMIWRWSFPAYLALDNTWILAPSDYFYHFSFPSYGRLKSKTNFSNVFLRSCSLIPLMHCS